MTDHEKGLTPSLIKGARKTTIPAPASPVEASSMIRLVFWIVALIVLLCGSGVGIWHWTSSRTEQSSANNPSLNDHQANRGSAVSVQVVHPRLGGIDRVCVQPGSIEPYEFADLYAKVSGILLSERDANGKLIDIGTRIKKGDVIAKISVPEYDAEVNKNTAELAHANARVEQFIANQDAAVANAKAAKAKIVLVTALLKSKTAYRQFRQKQYKRMQALLDEKAIDARLVDESMDNLESAIASEEAGKEAIVTSALDAEAAAARVEQAKADLKNAKAQVDVAKAELDKSKVLLSYTQIISPYDGVITRRGFFRGDFIRSAAMGADKQPLFSVERTDLMRVVIQVPDRDVPFVDEGDEALIELDALPGASIKAKVSRCAESEDLSTRTMRTEVDIPNPTGRLRRGMYGRATITLAGGTANSLTIPSSALSGDATNGNATVRVVRNDHAEIIPVKIANDNGIEVEVVSGLTPDDQVIVRTNSPIEQGTPVTIANDGKQLTAGHK